MSSPFFEILPHVFIIYSALYTITGFHWLSLLTCITCVIALLIYKLPKSAESDSDEVLEVDGTPIIAHKGGALDAPENTLAAIRLAKQNGATAIEFDVGYTSDGHAVVIHDDTVDATTDSTGLVEKMNLDRIRTLNASARHPKGMDFPNEKVPTLEEVIRLCLDLGLKMYIDVKGDAKLSAEKICEMYQKFPTLYKNAAVCSFYPQIVYMVKHRDCKIVTGLTHRHVYLSCEGDGTRREGPIWQKILLPVADVLLEWAQYSWLWYLCGTSTFLISRKDVNMNVVERFKQRGIRVVVWTVNDPDEKRYMENVIHTAYMTDTLVNL